jgi:hypothetical protein
MKFIKWWLDNFIVGLFSLGSIIITLFCLILLGAMLFGYNPYYQNKSTGSVFGFTNFVEGIPIKIEFNNAVPDTAINIYTARQSALLGADGKFARKFVDSISASGQDSIVSSDTLTLRYELDNGQVKPAGSASEQLRVAGSMNLRSGQLYMLASTKFQRGMLIMPILFFLCLIAYCFWQFSRFIHLIQSGHAFHRLNHTRIRNIGFALIAYNFLLLVLDKTFYQFGLLVSFESNGGSPGGSHTLSARPDLDYGFSYFISGCIFLIVASAFKRGYQLQQEQALTI